MKTSNWKNIRLGLGLNIHVSTLKYIQDRWDLNVTENQKQYLISVKNVNFLQNGHFTKKKVILFTMKNAMFFDFLIGDSKFMANKKLRFFDENSISKVLKKLFSGLVMWQSDSICSTMSIFDSIWKLNLKTSEFSRLLIQIRKRTKTLKFVFQNIKKWTCEFSPAYFLEKWQIWTKNQHGTFESKISNSK